MRNSILCILAIFAAISCTKEIKYNGQYDGEKLVLYSCAVPGEPLTANVFKSRFILDKDQNGLYNPLTGVSVIVTVNDTRTYAFHEELVEEKTVYVSNYIPAAGDHFVIEASLAGVKSIRGETSVPRYPNAEMASLNIKDDTDNELITINAGIQINDPANSSDYYRIRATINDSRMTLISNDILFYDASVESMIESIDGMEYIVPDQFDDGAFNGQSHTFPVWFNVYNEEMSYDEYIKENPISFYAVSMSESMYFYLKSLSAYNGMGGITGVFGEPVQIYSNIENGLGCVGALSEIEFAL